MIPQPGEEEWAKLLCPWYNFTVAGISENKITEQKAAGQLSAEVITAGGLSWQLLLCRQEKAKAVTFLCSVGTAFVWIGKLAVLLFRNIIHCGKCRKLYLISAVCDLSAGRRRFRLPVCLQITVKKLFDLLTAGEVSVHRSETGQKS